MGRVALLLCLFAATALAEEDFTKIQIRVNKVTDGIYMLDGVGGFAGGNIAVSVGDDGVVIVDDQFAPLAPKIKAALKGITNKPLRFIINTHWHGDHTGGNRELGHDAPIVAHENVRKRLVTGGKRKNGDEIKPAPREALPVITFNDQATLHLNGEDIRALHLPHGHTDGDSAIFFTHANVVHMGDDFFAGRFPFIDTESGGSVKGLIANLEKVIPELKPDVKIIPGHGSLSTLADLKLFLTMLRDTSALVETGLRAGKTAEQLKKEKVLARFHAYAWDFCNEDTFIDMLAGEPAPAPSSTKHH